jgi:hypothetical protein
MDKRVLASIGLWRKGSATVTVVLESDAVRVTPTIGNEFRVNVGDWLVRVGRLQDEGWVKEGSEPPEEASGVHTSSPPPSPSEPPKIILPGDTVLRRKDGKVYLMTRQEGGWNSFAFPVASEAWVAEKFNVRLGKWSRDEYGEFCPVIRVVHRMISKPPRPGDRKTG